MQVTLTIPDEDYQSIAERARAEGFGSTEVFLTTLIKDNASREPDIEHLFTPQVLEAADKAAQEIADGKGMTLPQVNEFLLTKRAEWIKTHRP